MPAKRSKYKDMSIWEMEESIDYSSLSDELLDALYDADEELRAKLLRKNLAKPRVSTSKLSNNIAQQRKRNIKSQHYEFDEYDEYGDYDESEDGLDR